MEQYQNVVVLVGSVIAVPEARNNGVLLIGKEDVGPGTVKAFCVDKAQGDDKYKIAIIAQSTVKEESIDAFDDIDLFTIELVGQKSFYYYTVSSDCVNIRNGNLNITIPDLEDDDVQEFFDALKTGEEYRLGITVIGVTLPEEEADDDFFAGILNSDDDDEDDEEDQDPITEDDVDDEPDEDEPEYRKEENFVAENPVVEPDNKTEEVKEEMKIESKVIDESSANEDSVFIRGKQTIKDTSVEQPEQKPIFKEVRIVDDGDPKTNKDFNRKDFNKNKPKNNKPGYVPNKSTVKDNSFKGNHPKPKNDNPGNLPSTKGTNKFGGW